jgi:stage II sporulation protein P
MKKNSFWKGEFRVRYAQKLRLSLTMLLLLISATIIAGAANESYNEHSSDDYYIIHDESGNVLSMMSLLVSAGDYLITEDNRGYTITGVEGFKAKARFDQIVDLDGAATLGVPGVPRVSERGPGLVAVPGSAPESLPAQTSQSVGPIVTYCTHSGESYEPTSGTDNKKYGDIFEVQDALANALKKKGFEVVASKDNFNPHDADAYMRSRRTAAQLLQKRPVVMIDIHRDGIPNASYYRREVSGQQVAATRLVVGRQNVNRGVNFEFAKQIKAAADKLHPGLVREIFWAKGNYNQDLAPRSILIEFGTHKNSLDNAAKGAALMADPISQVITGTAGNRAAGISQGQATGRSASRAVWWVLGLVVVGAVGFVLLNSGSWGRVKERFGKFFRQEVGLGKKDNDGPEGE